MRASGAKVEHTELDDLLLDAQKRQQQAEVEAAEVSEANNKTLHKKRQKKKTRWLSMDGLSEKQKR